MEKIKRGTSPPFLPWLASSAANEMNENEKKKLRKTILYIYEII